MSNPLKKIVDGVKKVFKKVVKTVKKVVQSDFFKIAAAAAAIYFTAGVASGALGGASAAGSGAAAGASAGSAAATAGLGTTIQTGVGTAMSFASPASAAAFGAKSAASSVIGGLATAGKAVGAFAKANPLLTSTALTTGGNMLAAYAESEEERKRENTMRQNSEYDLNVYDSWNGNQQSYATDSRPMYAQEGGQPSRAPGPAPVQNVDQKPAHYYDPSRDTWAPVTAAAKRTTPTGNGGNA